MLRFQLWIFFFFAALGGTRHLAEDFGQPANKRHTMSHAPDEIPEMESPIKRRKPEKKPPISPVKAKKIKVCIFWVEEFFFFFRFLW